MADILVDNANNPTVVKAKIKVSKTDKFRKGVDIFIGRMYNQLCPVEALMAYVAVRGQDDYSSISRIIVFSPRGSLSQA